MANIKGWFIWSFEHDGWWQASHQGYTCDKLFAGLYSYDEALEIVTQANRYSGESPNEAMLPAY